MEYILNRVNLVLLALVGGLCIYQWSGERKADREIEDLRHSVQKAEDHIAAQDQSLRGANEDIDEFKKVIAESKLKSDADDVALREKKAQVFTLEQQAKRAISDADLSAKTIAAYKLGINDRDANIKILLEQRQKLIDANQDAAQKANQAITAYNELANKYGTLVAQYNDLGKRYKALTAPPSNDQAAKPGA